MVKVILSFYLIAVVLGVLLFLIVGGIVIWRWIKWFVAISAEPFPNRHMYREIPGEMVPFGGDFPLLPLHGDEEVLERVPLNNVPNAALNVQGENPFAQDNINDLPDENNVGIMEVENPFAQDNPAILPLHDESSEDELFVSPALSTRNQSQAGSSRRLQAQVIDLQEDQTRAPRRSARRSIIPKKLQDYFVYGSKK